MTTIYLTNYQYQQVLDGMITTHLDKLDNNHDGLITQSDSLVACSYNSHKGGGILYGYADFYDGSDESHDQLLDTEVMGLFQDGIGNFSEVALDCDGPLYGYNLETLNKVIDYYNNGGGYCDDDFEKHVYEGIGATGKVAPEDIYKKSTIQSVNAKDIVVTNENGSPTMSYKEEQAVFTYELLDAGATDLKFTEDGMVGSYKLGGLTYNVSKDMYGDYSANDALIQEYLSVVAQLGDKVTVTEADVENLRAKLNNLKTEQNALTEKAGAAKAEYERQAEELEEDVKESNNIQKEIEKVNDELEDENNNLKKAGATKSSKSTSLTRKAGSLSSKLGNIKNDISTRNFAVIYSKLAMNSINENLTNVSVQVEDVNTQITDKTSEIADLNAQIEAKQAELASL